MKLYFLRMLVMWRRFRRGSRPQREHHMHVTAQAESFMRRANPFASWHERVNWMIDVAEWVRREPPASLMQNAAWRRIKQQRLRLLLDWLDAHRDARRLVQATLQKTLREAAGPQFFFTTGLPREPAFFSELSGRIIQLVLPKPVVQRDLSALVTAMFSAPVDANWLQGLDPKTVARVWKLCADEVINHTFRQQIDEALIYLVTVILSVGISPAFRQRLDVGNSLQATPFMALRRELEKYLQSGTHDDTALRSVRMLIAVCQAQTDRIYGHLDEHGVSVSLVYCIERMRAQLTRMAQLIDLRAAASQGHPGSRQMQALLAGMIAGHHQRSLTRGLMRRSFSLLARKMVERNERYGHHDTARNARQYRGIFKAACIGGSVIALTVLGKVALSGTTVARFFEGMLASLNYAISLTAIAAVGGVLAAKQPVVTSAVLAARMNELDSADGMRALLEEVAALLRAQAAAIFGNVVALIPVMAAVSLAVLLLSGAPVMPADKAHASLQALSMLGITPLLAAITGILLWFSSLTAGFADNWFAWHRLRETLACHRRWVQALGPVRAQRWASWLERNVAGIVGNVSLAIALGMTPVLAQFFGMPFDIRHVTLASGELVAAVSSLGWLVLPTPEFWLAAVGIVVTGLLNVAVAFSCGLIVALRVSGVSGRVRRLVYRAILKRFLVSPHLFLFSNKHKNQQDTVISTAPHATGAVPLERKNRSGKGR